MRFLSLFSGIEGASVAWCKPPLNWECVGFSEIESFPCALLQHYYPDVPNLGDITKITEEQIAALGHIDLVIFGSPCTDFSVAGKRAGLKDEEGNITRSGLFYTAMDIVRFARKRCGLRWAILENVPGIYSSHEGRDFSTVIGEMVGCGFDVPAKGWGNSGIAIGPDGLCEWACLDARYFGVAQRRRRVFAVCDYAIFDSGNWRSRSSVLLERKGLRGNSSTMRKKGEDVAGTIASRFGAIRNNPEELAPIGIDEEGNATEDGFGPLMDGGDCRGLELKNTAQIQRHQITGGAIPINGMTLNKELKDKQTTGIGKDGDPSPTLRSSGNQHTVAVDIYNTKIDGDVCATLSNEGGSPTGSGPKVLAFAQNTRDEVRLQGGDGQNVGALAAESGMKQTTYLAIERPVATAILGTLLGRGENSGPEGNGLSEELSFTLTKNDVHAVAQVNMQGSKGNCVVQEDGPSFTLNAMHGHDVHAVAVRTANTSANGHGVSDECAHTLDRAQGQRVVCPIDCREGTSPCLTAKIQGSSGWAPQNETEHLVPVSVSVQGTSMALRRLTPEECEALQGFPRGHTKIPWKGKSVEDCPDSVRYKSLGNSFAVPVIAYIGRRIQKVMDEQHA